MHAVCVVPGRRLVCMIDMQFMWQVPTGDYTVMANEILRNHSAKGRTATEIPSATCIIGRHLVVIDI